VQLLWHLFDLISANSTIKAAQLHES